MLISSAKSVFRNLARANIGGFLQFQHLVYDSCNVIPKPTEYIGYKVQSSVTLINNTTPLVALN